MKKTIFFFLGLAALAVSSCSDMLDVDNKRNIDADNAIDSKTDSLFYAFGIMQAMQQAADMYVLQNEMRGDLVSTTSYASTHLQELADYSATTTNKYDSAYVYYKVVNNCNNYLAHRDSALYDGSYNVTTEEIGAVHAYRAWAYLQLARMYKRVKFFTHPLTSISQIESDQSPELDIQAIVSQLAPSLERYSGQFVPQRGLGTTIGTTTYTGTTKNFMFEYGYIPVDVILGEMYLETGDWLAAAKHYYKYLVNNRILAHRSLAAFELYDENLSMPGDLSYLLTGEFENYFDLNSYAHAVTYIPMATNRLNGQTTELPELFGYDYYATRDASTPYVNPQIASSKVYEELADSALYYYISSFNTSVYSSVKAGDMRRMSRRNSRVYVNDTRYDHQRTYDDGFIVLYRPSTIWLHLAEALNRLGHPDAAFAILKDGVSDKLNNPAEAPYITEKTRALFAEGGPVPFFGAEASALFTTTNGQSNNYGIHGHGCAAPFNGSITGLEGTASKYQMGTEVARKLAEIEKEFNLSLTYNVEKDSVVDVTGMNKTAVDLAVTKAITETAAKAVPAGTYSLTYRLVNEDEAKNTDGDWVVVNTEEDGVQKKTVTVVVVVSVAEECHVINAMEDLLCDEYAMELAFEGSRFTDLTRMARHKNADSKVAPIYGANFGSRWFSNKIRRNNPNVVKDLTVESNWYLPLK